MLLCLIECTDLYAVLSQQLYGSVSGKECVYLLIEIFDLLQVQILYKIKNSVHACLCCNNKREHYVY